MSPTPTIIEPAPRLRSATALARTVVRDLAGKDAALLLMKQKAGIPVDAPTASSQIKAWRDDAANARDSAVAGAIDLLGVREAARAYALGPRRGSLSKAEREKLARAARKARS